MSKVHSHYENLRVPRDASPKAIREAYRSLSQKNHPDRNPGKDDAADIMAMLNVAYEALSDPRKRSEHDEWIARSEREVPREVPRNMAWKSVYPAGNPRQGAAFASPSPAPRSKPALPEGRAKKHLRRYAIVYAAAAVSIALASMVGLQSTRSMQTGLAEKFAKLAPKSTGYMRPATAPNGKPWPQRTGYIEGFPVLNADGASELIVDNTQNDVDMFAKLVALDGSRTVVVRNFLVSAHATFTVRKLSTGSYDLRYRNLRSGDLQRSQLFEAEDVKTSSGLQHSTVTLPLYTSQNGNMQTFALSESEF